MFTERRLKIIITERVPFTYKVLGWRDRGDNIHIWDIGLSKGDGYGGSNMMQTLMRRIREMANLREDLLGTVTSK